MRISVHGGRVVDPAQNLDAVCDVHMEDTRIVALGVAPEGFSPDRRIDASSHLVLPGLIELSAHLGGGDPGATLRRESLAAVAGGITTLCTPPDLDPCIDTPAAAELIHLHAARHGHARVVTLGALTRGLDGEHLTEMGALRETGCPALSNGRRPIPNSLVLRRALEYASSHSLTVLLHPQDPGLSEGGCVHEGEVATRLGLPGIPPAAEVIGVSRDLALVELTGARVHFCRLSTGAAVEQVRAARARGLPVTADVAAHQLHLTDRDIDAFDTSCHLVPPLRGEEDRQALRAGVADGTLEIVCADHRPLGGDAKRAPFASTVPGASGLDTLLALGLALVEQDLLDLPTLVARLSLGPARLLGLPGGHLKVGASADLCIVDPTARRVLDSAEMLSRGHNSPFVGRELPGRVTHTLVNGTLAWQLDPTPGADTRGMP